MRFETYRTALSLSLGFGLLMLLPASASAQDCSYEDLQGKFTVTVDCDALQDFTGHSQHHKRIWLSGPLGEVQVMEAPEPYRNVELSVLMKTLGRSWNDVRTPHGPKAATVGSAEALFQTRRRNEVSSRTYVFKLGGRNLSARLAVVGPRNDRAERKRWMTDGQTLSKRYLNCTNCAGLPGSAQDAGGKKSSTPSVDLKLEALSRAFLSGFQVLAD